MNGAPLWLWLLSGNSFPKWVAIAIVAGGGSGGSILHFPCSPVAGVISRHLSIDMPAFNKY